MIKKENLKQVLLALDYIKKAHKEEYVKEWISFDCCITVDFKNEKIIYPEDKGMIIHRKTTCNFSEPENFVVLECITSLLDKGYKPEHIELEKPMPGGHDDTGGFCDIQVKDNTGKTFLLIECKKENEFEKFWKKTLADGDQLFRYYNSYRSAQALCLYMSDFTDDNKLKRYTNIISMVDNEEYLQTDKSLKSFKDVQSENGDKEDYFKVWKETYQQDYATSGIFESDIDAYTVGKNKFTVDDLEEVDNDSIQKKYHEFATILRQHNVGSHENAFDKLINLFLAKIVDETINPSELQFYWKGAAYDDYYSLQDRLQKLYKEGMEKFLGEQVTYIDQKQVSDAFHLFKNDPDATKRTVLNYFKQLKFYTNSDFAFLDVHNEELFYQNAVILKKIVKMLEDIKLKTKEQNQFLGDLFEGFLDDGVKQSEGQFFTPLPIVKFLVSSLPLEEIIRDNSEIPKAIDYACGAGHFLTEYASAIKEYIEKYKKTPVSEYYKEIYGIEKEYRLSKVSKVSAFMYGQDDIQIIYADALANNARIFDSHFKVLIANPPYSVKGFLETLTDNERSNYELSAYVSDISKNNSIETFFIERAKQLLASDGVAAIILPTSVLSNGNIYIACREILLKYFEIVSIVELGSGTFGKTGTSTATLFLKRRNTNPDISEHYLNRVNSWFNGDSTKDIVFDDTDYVLEYCEHCGMLDFTRVDFDKAIRTSGIESKITPIESKYPIVSVDKLAKISRGASPRPIEKFLTEDVNGINWIKIGDVAVGEKYITHTAEKITNEGAEKSRRVKPGDFIVSNSMSVGRPYISKIDGCIHDGWLLLSEISSGIDTEYFYYVLSSEIAQKQLFDSARGGVVKNLNISRMSSIKIPVPPKSIQTSLVNQLNDIENQISSHKATINSLIANQHAIMNTISGDKVKISSITSYITTRINFSSIQANKYITTDNMLQSFGGITENTNIPNVDKVIEYKIGDILVSNIRPYLKKIYFSTQDGGCSPDVLVFRVNDEKKVLPKYLYYLMRTDSFFEWAMSDVKGMKMPRGKKETISSYEVPLIPLDEQEKIVKLFEDNDRKIYELQNKITTLLSSQNNLINQELI